MSESAEILEEADDYRLALYIDVNPEEPYDEGQSPLLRIELGTYSGVRGVEHIGSTARPTEDDAAVESAVRKWGGPNGNDWPKFEKYLRAFYGVMQVETYASGDYWYVTYDPQRWREWAGAEPGSASLAEWKAYCEGEVYYWAIEQKTTWVATDSPALPSRETWETKDSVGGYYGRDFAAEVARENWQSFRENEISKSAKEEGTP